MGDQARAAMPGAARNLARRFQMAQASQLPCGLASQAALIATVTRSTAINRTAARMSVYPNRGPVCNAAAGLRRQQLYASAAHATARTLQGTKYRQEVMPIPTAVPAPKTSSQLTTPPNRRTNSHPSARLMRIETAVI